MLVNSHLLAKKLNEILPIVAEVLSESQEEDIRMFIDGGEWGLAFETLCEFLYEDELPIASKAYELLEEIESLLKLDSSLLENLKSQVSD